MCPCGGVNHSHAVIHIGRGTRLSASRPASSLREARAGDAEGSSLATAVYTAPPGAAAAPGATLLGLHCGPDVFRCFFLSPGAGGGEASRFDVRAEGRAGSPRPGCDPAGVCPHLTSEALGLKLPAPGPSFRFQGLTEVPASRPLIFYLLNSVTSSHHLPHPPPPPTAQTPDGFIPSVHQ